jgi:hypothetical protein
MQTPIPRRFTVIDAMLLIASAALSLVLIRGYLASPSVRFSLSSVPSDQTVASLWRLATIISGVLAPLAVSLSLGLLILRLKAPRPALRRVFRQPGMIACSAAVTATTVVVVKVLCIAYFMNRMPNLQFLWLRRLSWNGEVVVVAWILLWLSGRWRSEAGWIDRAGRVLGTYWVISGVFFSYAF